MRYIIQRYAGDVLMATYLRIRRDHAVRCFERCVFDQVKGLAGLDTIWGKRAVCASYDAGLDNLDLCSVPVGPDHRVTFKRLSGSFKHLNRGR